ncbi:hypothetical protein BD413DRAFT_315045 [Trametes elegans]|nr:hypothetical protein BD413DRAFT_315045 [Trametes elegans]
MTQNKPNQLVGDRRDRCIRGRRGLRKRAEALGYASGGYIVWDSRPACASCQMPLPPEPASVKQFVWDSRPDSSPGQTSGRRGRPPKAKLAPDASHLDRQPVLPPAVERVVLPSVQDLISPVNDMGGKRGTVTPPVVVKQEPGEADGGLSQSVAQQLPLQVRVALPPLLSILGEEYRKGKPPAPSAHLDAGYYDVPRGGRMSPRYKPYPLIAKLRLRDEESQVPAQHRPSSPTDPPGRTFPAIPASHSHLQPCFVMQYGAVASSPPSPMSRLHLRACATRHSLGNVPLSSRSSVGAQLKSKNGTNSEELVRYHSSVMPYPCRSLPHDLKTNADAWEGDSPPCQPHKHGPLDYLTSMHTSDLTYKPLIGCSPDPSMPGYAIYRISSGSSVARPSLESSCDNPHSRTGTRHGTQVCMGAGHGEIRTSIRPSFTATTTSQAEDGRKRKPVLEPVRRWGCGPHSATSRCLE